MYCTVMRVHEKKGGGDWNYGKIRERRKNTEMCQKPQDLMTKWHVVLYNIL